MNTPITKRVHMNAAKKNSIAKSTEDNKDKKKENKPNTTQETGYYVKDGKRYKYDASVIPSTNAAGATLTAPEAKSGGKAGVPWENKMKNLFKSGVSVDELVKKGHGTKEGLSNLFKGLEQNTGTTQGKVDIKDKLVMTDPTKGTTVDTSTAYNVRQISRGQKKSARDVRRARIKLSKLSDFDYNPDGSINMESIKPKEGLSKNARKMAKFNESLSELKSMQNTQKRITDMAKAGVDPRRTARFESGTEMKAGTPGGPDTNVEGLETAEQVRKRLSENVNLGSTNSEESNTSQGDALSSKLGTMPQGDALNKILRENIDKKAKVNKPVSTAMSNAVSQGYSTSTMFAKKYNKPTSMLKKSCMKMGGFGSKTYKK